MAGRRLRGARHARRAVLALGLLRAATAVCAPAPPARPELAVMLPAPGTYRLERIMQAPEGLVLESDGSLHRLSEFTTGKVTLFSFIYTYCTDARGCPLAYETMHALKKSIEADPALHGKVRFVSMSFDPEFDTPAAMRSYGGQDALDRRGLRWHFLTSRSGEELAPMLDGFGQDVRLAAQPPGQRAPVFSHVLKVYLLDRSGAVREIYSTSFLHPDVLLNDIRTLVLEERRSPLASPRKQ
jgi:cytochrome oxidase Cu insertion factor (SCO1/SenC/PrrC family)